MLYRNFKQVCCLGVVLWLTAYLSGCSSLPPERVIEPATQEVVQRGFKLVTGLAACGYCHGAQSSPQAPLTGGRELYDSYGPIIAPNITPVKDGIGSWSSRDIVRALRASVGPGDRELSPEMHRGYEWLSDRDVFSIVAYLRSLSPEGEVYQRREVSFLGRNTKGFFEKRLEVTGGVPELPRKDLVIYGTYLVDHVARCGMCHNSPSSIFGGEGYLLGGKIIRVQQGEAIAPSLAVDGGGGLSGWQAEDIVRYLRTGLSVDNREIDRSFCPVEFYSLADEIDLKAIAAALLRQ